MASRIMPMSDSPFNKPRPTISLSPALKERIEVAAAPYQKPPGRKFEYGTAGVSHPHLFLPLYCAQIADLAVLSSSG
jgi:hypothetical protein